MSRSLDCHCQRTLVSGARAELAPRLDLAALRDVATQARGIFVIDLPNLVDAESAHLAPPTEAATATPTRSAPAARATRAARTAPATRTAPAARTVAPTPPPPPPPRRPDGRPHQDARPGHPLRTASAALRHLDGPRHPPFPALGV